MLVYEHTTVRIVRRPGASFGTRVKKSVNQKHSASHVFVSVSVPHGCALTCTL